jgi:hypothetical protein
LPEAIGAVAEALPLLFDGVGLVTESRSIFLMSDMA